MEDVNVSISIYQSPEINHPDESGQIGNVSLLLPTGSPEQLSGEVTLQGVEQGSPVEGIFDLTTVTGEKFRGKFIAEWENEVVYWDENSKDHLVSAVVLPSR
ncbi:MAG TPA: hypothetical protein VF918_03570 [Anaerolineales bacterium]